MKSPRDQKIIQIDITNACGHSCSNCTRFCGHHKKPFFMDFDTFKRAVDSMEGRFGTTGIMGGEPTMHPEFERFTEYSYGKVPAAYRSNLNEFAYPQRNFMKARDYAHNAYSVTHHWTAGTRNVVCGVGLWSSMSRSYKKHFEVIQDRFRYQVINDHNNAMYHQPVMITRKELGIDDKTFKRLRDNCWVQQLWSGAITPKGAFFCEIAAALDMLLDGPGGWPIEKGWWNRTEKDFGSQIEWCEMCGIALETFSRDARDEIDDASPFWMEKLKALNSPKLKSGKVNALKIENSVIDERSKPLPQDDSFRKKIDTGPAKPALNRAPRTAPKKDLKKTTAYFREMNSIYNDETAPIVLCANGSYAITVPLNPRNYVEGGGGDVKSPKDQKIIQIDITNACGHSCSNCTRFCGHHKKPFFMDFDTFKRAVDSLEGHFGTTGIMGGEPTMHPEFERFTEYLYSKIPAEYRSNLNEFAYPQRNFMKARDYAHDAYSVTHHWAAGTRNVICGVGILSSMNRSYKKHFEVIQDRFRYQVINDHNNAMYHQPIMITRKELGIDDKTFKRLRDNCWVQQLWSGAITPKGAFFCEIAAALDMLLDGPGGWPIEKGWWNRTEKDFGSQIEWCEMCGIALKTFGRDAREEIDDASPFWMEKLKTLNSPKLKSGKINLIKIENGVINETSKSCGKAFNLEAGGEPYANVHEDKFSVQKSILYPAGFDGVMIAEKHDAANEEKYRSRYGTFFDSLQFILKDENFGRSVDRVLAETNPDRYIIIFTENVIPAPVALDGLSKCIINPGTLHYIDFSRASNKNNAYFENSASLENGFAALFNKRALSLRRFGFDRIAAARGFEEILPAWESEKIVLFTPEMEYYPKPRKAPFQPLISFVIPFYNRFDLLKEAVRSIADSDFKNAEIILIDDGSDEYGKDELLEFMNNTPNIIYIRNEENSGPGAVRNQGLKRSRGEWVFFMDSDDIIYSEKLPELADFLKKEQDSDVIIFSKAKYKFPDGHIENRFYADGAFDKFDKTDNIDEILDKILNNFRNNSFGGTLWNFCYRRAFLEDNKICFPETFAGDDETFSTTAWFYAKKTACFSGYFYEYRLYTPLSINSQIEQFDCKSEKIWKGRSEYFNRLLELYESDLPRENARRVEDFIYQNILCAMYEPERYNDNIIVKRCLDSFHDVVTLFSKNGARKLYIAPCFMGAVNAVALLNSWGFSVGGFVDKSPSSPRAGACKKESGIDVCTIDSLIKGGMDGGILVFSKHAAAIERLLNSLGLAADKDYLKTGLL